MTEAIRGAVAKIDDSPIRFVLNTHWHQDHTGGNENLGRAGALLLAHDRVRARLEKGQHMRFFGREIPPAPPAALPVVTFGRDLTLHLNAHEIHVSHVAAAHTDGDAIVHFRDANVLHMGDLFFSGMCPFFDGESGGSVDGMIAGLAAGLALCDGETKIIPGHGPLSSRVELKAAHAMLTQVRGRIAGDIDAGRSLDDVVASRPTADLDARWAGGFLEPDVFVRLVFQSLSAR